MASRSLLRIPFLGMGVLCLAVCLGGQCGPTAPMNVNLNEDMANENADGETNGNENGDGQPAAFEVIDTELEIDVEGVLRASDRFIAFRSNSVNRVFDTMTETQFDLNPEDGTELANDFAISGSIAVARNATNVGIYSFDAENPDAGVNRVGTFVTLSGTTSGLIDTDGGNIIAFVTSEPFICWVDTNEEELAISTLGQFPDSPDGTFRHVSVSGARIAFFDVGDTIKIKLGDTVDLEIDAEFEVNANTEFPLDYKDGVIAYVDADSGEVNTIDVSSGDITSTGITAAGPGFSSAPGSLSLRTSNGRVCMFSDEASFDNTSPSAVAEAGATGATVAPDQELVSRTSAGWGSTCAFAEDGDFIFTAGDQDPTNAQSDVLSVWTDSTVSDSFSGNFVPPIDDAPDVVSASDVFAADGLVVFKLHTGESLVARVGYIDLD